MALSRKTREIRNYFPCPIIHQKWVDHFRGTCSEKGQKLPDLIYPGYVNKGSQVTDSEGHPFWNRRKVSGSLKDIGGDFFSQKKYAVALNPSNITASALSFITSDCDIQYQFNGRIYPISPATGNFPASTSSSTLSDLDMIGATAVARCKPTNNIADASQFLGELLRDGIPRVTIDSWEGVTGAAREAGSQYLNQEFGWKPFVGDLKKFAFAVRHADEVLSQYERDAGKVVRRQYHFPIDVTRSSQTYSVESPPVMGGTLPAELRANVTGMQTEILESESRRWFSGAFTYHLPSGYHSRDEMTRLASKAKQLFGIELTPETIWNLSPWSWAVDWFSNTGDVISNISDMIHDGLVMQYGYVMEHTINKRTYLREPVSVKNGVGGYTSLCFVTETKMRRKANPFGFGVNWSGLTPRQLSIAAALGITRS